MVRYSTYSCIFLERVIRNYSKLVNCLNLIIVVDLPKQRYGIYLLNKVHMMVCLTTHYIQNTFPKLIFKNRF